MSKRSLWRKFLLWMGLKTGLIQVKQEPLTDSRLKEIKDFDEWLSYIKEIDPQAFQELVDLGKEPIVSR